MPVYKGQDSAFIKMSFILKILYLMSNYTYEEAIAAAANYGLEEEIKYLMDHGFTPDEALREWDCEPEDSVIK